MAKLLEQGKKARARCNCKSMGKKARAEPKQKKLDEPVIAQQNLERAAKLEKHGKNAKVERNSKNRVKT